MTKSEIWILSEWAVAQDRARNHGERLLKHRWRCPFAEIDLLFGCEKSKVLRMIEVKSVRAIDSDLAFSISRRQIRRLQNGLIWLESRVDRPIELNLAVVSQSQRNSGQFEIQYFDLEGDDY